MAEIGRVVTVRVKYMGVIPDKIVFAGEGAKPYASLEGVGVGVICTMLDMWME
jgi:hypothetical protein